MAYRIAAYIITGLIVLFFAFPLINRDAIDFNWQNNVRVSPVSLPAEPIVFVFGGDVMLGRRVNWELKQSGDYGSPFANIRELWQDADAVMINLESPLYESCPVNMGTSTRFCAESVFAEVLAGAGITHISFANNHTQDYGKKGASDTNFYFNQQGLTVINHGEPVISEVKGKQIGFLSWNLTWNNVLEQEIRHKIQEIRDRADLVVVNFHWGEEYTDEPGEYQRQIAHLAVDSGADIVVGHHPHHIQPAEVYQGKLIFYSLGNLIFDQLWSEKTRQGILATVRWNSRNNQLSYATSTIYMQAWAKAMCVTGCGR